ncbi:MAG: hypothetical protein A2Z32_04145 [Chloroflexi bacterium RBG_16_69_14]|nr:MAG: hypothetical protein A2Z32_04145 [Chloroflexi bacterium RBG_16_69_14]
MIRRTLTSLSGAAVLTLSLASTSLAETLPNGNVTFASGSFTQTIKGVEYAWFVRAARNTVDGTTAVTASYNTAVDTTGHGGDQDGQPGARFISFNGQGTVPILIPATLGFAIAGARLHGTETTFDTCTGAEAVVNKRHTVALALEATAPAETSSGQKCVDTEQVLKSTFTFRTAAGFAFVNGRRSAVADGTIGHDVWSYQPDPSCADA